MYAPCARSWLTSCECMLPCPALIVRYARRMALIVRRACFVLYGFWGLKHLISSPCIGITNDAAVSVPRKLVALPMFEPLSVKNIVLRLKGIDFNHRDKQANNVAALGTFRLTLCQRPINSQQQNACAPSFGTQALCLDLSVMSLSCWLRNLIHPRRHLSCYACAGTYPRRT